MRKLGWIAAICMGAIGLFGPFEASAQHDKRFAEAANTGKLSEGIADFEKIVAASPEDGTAALALGALHFLSALEGLQKDMYRFGAGNQAARGIRGFLPVFRVPVPVNSAPETATYQKVREMLEQFAGRLEKARTVLGTVGERPAKLRVSLMEIGFDINGDGKVEVSESLAGTLSALAFRGNSDFKGAWKPIAFDTADANWLEGYSNVLLSFANFFLAFNFEKSYDATFHVVFGEKSTLFGRQLIGLKGDPAEIAALQKQINETAKKLEAAYSNEDRRRLSKLYKDRRTINRDKTKTKEQKQAQIAPLNIEIKKFEKLRSAQNELRGTLRRLNRQMALMDPTSQSDDMFRPWLDPISFLHSISWEVENPERLKQVRQNLLNMVRLNKETWRLVALETDDDREWLPGPNQTSPFPSLKVTQEIIDSWEQTLSGLEAVLEGKMLIPSLRFGRGVNLKKFFETAKSFDFILFLTGPNAAGYAERGPVMNQRFMRMMGRPMGRNFGAYALWFN